MRFLESHTRDLPINDYKRAPAIKGFLVSTVVLAGAHEEVDGVRKEKERLTTDHQPQGNVRWFMVVNLSLFSFVPLTINRP